MKTATSKRRFAKLLVGILLLSMVLGGCTMDDGATAAGGSGGNNQPEFTGEMQSGEGKKIGFSIAMLAGSPFWQVISDELSEGFEALGYEFVVLDAQGDVAKQMSDVEDLISQQVDMILINPYDSKAIVPVTLQAKSAGIPVFAVDIPIDESGYYEATTICDNHTIGYNLGWYAGGLFNNPDLKVIVISGYPGGIDSYDRRFGFIEGLHNYQLEKFNRTGVEIVYHGWGDYAFDPANKTMEDALVRTGGEFDILYAENDPMAIGALKAMQDAGVTGKVILGVDGYREMFDLIISGEVTATGLNSPVELGEVTVEAVHQFLNGIEVQSWIYTTPEVVDAGNVMDFYDKDSPF